MLKLFFKLSNELCIRCKATLTRRYERLILAKRLQVNIDYFKKMALDVGQPGGEFLFHKFHITKGWGTTMKLSRRKESLNDDCGLQDS